MEGINPRGLHGHRCSSRVEKGEGTEEGNRSHRHVARDSKSQERPGQKAEDGKGGKHRDEQWRPSGKGDVQVDRRSALGRVGGEKRVQQIEVDWR